MNLTVEANLFEYVPLDVLIEIAAYDENAWYNLYRVDSLFNQYAKSNAGIHKYIILFTKRTIECGYIKTRLFGALHSIYDEPATINCEDGTKRWYKQGLLHRENDLPAIVKDERHYSWYQNGICHRDNDLPAIIYPHYCREWYKNGVCHRDNDLPAVIYNCGTQEWLINGLIHRDNGLPAIIRADGTREYWINNKRIQNTI